MHVTKQNVCTLLDRAIIGALFLLVLLLLGVHVAHADHQPIARLLTLLR